MRVNKKVLVTGGAGFIGSHTVDALIERGYHVRVLDCLTPQVHGDSGEKPSHLHPDAEFIKGDVRDKDQLYQAIKGMDLLIHDAAEVGLGQSMYSIEQYVSVNVQGTAVLWDILVNQEHNIEKVLVASSMSIYGEGKYRCATHGDMFPIGRPDDQYLKGIWEVLCPECNEPLQAIGTDESKPLHCTSVYAQSKKDQEEYSLIIGRAYKIPTVACRYFNCYGPRQSLDNPYTGAAAIFSSAIKNGTAPLIYEDGHQQRDFIHVKDVVQGKLLVLENPEVTDGIFNLGTGTPTSILELANTLIKLYDGVMEPNIIYKFRSGDIRNCYADASKIKALGFKPQFPLEKGLRDLVEWGSRQASRSKIKEAHQELMDKGLVG